MLSFDVDDFVPTWLMWTFGIFFGIVLLPLGLIFAIYEFLSVTIRNKKYDFYDLSVVFVPNFRFGVFISFFAVVSFVSVKQWCEELWIKFLFKIKFI